MAKLTFQDLKFNDSGSFIRVYFMGNFYFDITKEELERIGKFRIEKNSITFSGNENIMRKKFNFLLEKGLSQLKSLRGKSTIFIHDAPLIGSLYFGLIDRNTSIIELRPITGCNLKCIFCSVDMSKRTNDFVVQPDYLVDEFCKLARLKLQKVNSVEAHINTQGEPLLYARLPELVKGISQERGISEISMDTNGTLLTKEKIDILVKAGLTRFNISLNAFSQKTADKIAGMRYPLQHVIEMCKYAAEKANVLIAPVWLNRINDEDIEKIINFGLSLKKINPLSIVGIQNFLEYKAGGKPVKQVAWPGFYSWLHKLEQKHKTKLILSKEDFNIKKVKVLEKPFRKEDIVKAEIICQGRFKNEKLAKAGNRIIALPNCRKNGFVRVKITRDKHNIFYGKVL